MNRRNPALIAMIKAGFFLMVFNYYSNVSDLTSALKITASMS